MADYRNAAALSGITRSDAGDGLTTALIDARSRALAARPDVADVLADKLAPLMSAHLARERRHAKRLTIFVVGWSLLMSLVWMVAWQRHLAQDRREHTERMAWLRGLRTELDSLRLTVARVR